VHDSIVGSTFHKTTRARCVAGYVEDADWYPVAAFELVLMEALTWYRRTDAVHHWLTDQYPDLVGKLGFRMHYGALPSAPPMTTISPPCWSPP
jgi:hypothetical protein